MQYLMRIPLKSRFFCFFILLIGLGVNAQRINFSGTIRDSIQKPLLGASLVAIDNETNELDAYTITKNDGAFSLKLKSNKEYKVQVSALGLQTVNEKFLTKDEDIQKDYMSAFNQVVYLYDALKLDYEHHGFNDNSEELLNNYNKSFNIFKTEFEI